MAHALTPDQINNIVNNTMVVMLARPELLPEWRENLQDLLQQTREQNLEDEMLFVAAVLALLHSPEDTLPTGTVYDYAWDTLMNNLMTGMSQPADQNNAGSLDRLLQSLAEAVVTVLTRMPDHRDAVKEEVIEIYVAAQDAGLTELIAWVDDVLLVLDGGAPERLGGDHSGIYAAYWDAIVRELGSGTAG